jgi:hypothetical protein
MSTLMGKNILENGFQVFNMDRVKCGIKMVKLKRVNGAMDLKK